MDVVEDSVLLQRARDWSMHTGSFAQVELLVELISNGFYVWQVDEKRNNEEPPMLRQAIEELMASPRGLPLLPLAQFCVFKGVFLALTGRSSLVRNQLNQASQLLGDLEQRMVPLGVHDDRIWKLQYGLHNLTKALDQYDEAMSKSTSEDDEASQQDEGKIGEAGAGVSERGGTRTRKPTAQDLPRLLIRGSSFANQTRYSSPG